MGRLTTPGKPTESSLIPLIFTIGIIGWGFFAIARMTEGDDVEVVIPRRGVKVERSETSMLASFKSWLLEKITSHDRQSDNVKMKTLPSVPSAPISPSEDLPVLEDPLSKMSPQAQVMPVEGINIPEEVPIENLSQKKSSTLTSTKVYLYALDKQGNPHLKSVRREISGGDVRLLALQAAIQGPTAAEEMRDFIDSFPAKPKILSLQQQSDILVINFSDNFGTGVSHSTLKFQIQQLLYTAMQFEGIRAISIRINGKSSRHLGGDGIAVPERIDLVTLKNF